MRYELCVMECLKGGFLERSKLFLEKFGGFAEADPGKWTRVTHIYDVRNIFVHHAGYLPAYNLEKRLRQSMQSIPGLRAGHDYLSLGEEFCPFALRVTQELFDALFKDVASLCERVERFEVSVKK